MHNWYPPAVGDLRWNSFQQVLVPQSFRSQVLSLTHDNFSGHLAQPDYSSISIITHPMLREPFEHIILDCVGPLPKTKSGHQYLLTLTFVHCHLPPRSHSAAHSESQGCCEGTLFFSQHIPGHTSPNPRGHSSL